MPPRKKSILKPFAYETTYPVTVRQAALLNAIQRLSAKLIFEEFENLIKINSNKPKSNEIDSVLYILKRDSKWIKKHFMGTNGIDVTMMSGKPKPETKPKQETSSKKKGTRKQKKPTNKDDKSTHIEV